MLFLRKPRRCLLDNPDQMMKTKTFLLLLLILCLAMWRLPAAGCTGGHCFVAESGTGIVYDYAMNGTRTDFATNAGSPYGLAFDKAGNLFVANFDGGIYNITPNGSNNVFAYLYNGPAGLAIDSSSNLFVGVYGNGYIFQYTPGGSRALLAWSPRKMLTVITAGRSASLSVPPEFYMPQTNSAAIFIGVFPNLPLPARRALRAAGL